MPNHPGYHRQNEKIKLHRFAVTVNDQNLFFLPGHTNVGGKKMRKDEKQPAQPTPWEMNDPKPPVIHSGHMENRSRH